MEREFFSSMYAQTDLLELANNSAGAVFAIEYFLNELDTEFCTFPIFRNINFHVLSRFEVHGKHYLIIEKPPGSSAFEDDIDYTSTYVLQIVEKNRVQSISSEELSQIMPEVRNEISRIEG